MNPFINKSLQNGKYNLEQELGQGGFGITYKAINQNINQVVVIKTFNLSRHQNSNWNNSIPQFQDEAKKLARFSHPHIVQVKDFFIEDGLPYIVMDYIEGQNLGAIVLPENNYSES